MTPHQSRLSALLLCLTILLPLSSCGKKAQTTEPDSFTVDSEHIPTLNQTLDGQDATFVRSETTESAGGGSRGENSSPSDNPASQVYSFVYTDLPEGGKTVEAYMKALTKEDVGFVVINSEGKKDKPPDFYAENGTLYLARTNLKNLTDLSIRLDWNQNQLIIRAWQRALNAPFSPPEDPADWSRLSSQTSDKKEEAATATTETTAANPSENTAATTTDSVTILSAQEAVSFLKNLSPAAVGLPGSSMKNYNVYYTEGTAKVDGIVCMRLRVYQVGDLAGTNVFLGTYLLATDASHLYRLNPESGTAVEIPLT